MSNELAAIDSPGTLEALTADDPVLRGLIRAMRDGRGMSAEAAAREVLEMGAPADRVDDAVEKVRELARHIQTAQEPRGVVAGNIESWYLGPRTEDRNWTSLVRLLGEDGWTRAALADLDASSTQVVAHLPNPHGTDAYDCRGLVLGYVQSGKTTNFTAVIAKAADAGYRFFLVLGGVHNALRQQTQDRLNDQLVTQHPDFWHRLTNDDDFRPNDNVDALLGPANGQWVLAIVKKNGARLRALQRWLAGARPETLGACPMLIIDDEADQASINTARPDRDPSAMNQLIRDVIRAVPRNAYVGYTATPFANVLIDPEEETDLYPRDFVLALPQPSSYIGPEAVFGREPLEFDPDGVDDTDGGDFIREVPQTEVLGLRPRGSKARHDFVPVITDSLDEALRYFLLSTTARRIRRGRNRHATALVHTSQHVDIHRVTAGVIERHMNGLATRLARGDAPLIGSLKSQWEDEAERVPAHEWGSEPVGWADIAALLPTVAQDVTVITDNSQSDERLSFDDAVPRVIIAVGGNTLSRGLTLEGLSVSFFVRTASAYDTLLQMGRWFGYRNGYADLTRIWMTAEMRAWFHHLATVEQEIRFDIERYVQGHETPRDFGVRIRTHPKLAITAAAKMQHARRASQSYSGRRVQTILFNHRDAAWLKGNIAASQDLVRQAAAVDRVRRGGVQILGPLPSSKIEAFLRAYSFHEESRDLNGELMWNYISGRLDHGELTHFRVAVMGRGDYSPELGAVDLGLDQPINCINRARLEGVGDSTYADIKALMSRPDRAVDLRIPEAEFPRDARSLARIRNLPADGGRGDGSGLVLLYPVSKDSIPVRTTPESRTPRRVRCPLEAVDHVVGVGVVFPESRDSQATVDYVTAGINELGIDDVEVPDESDEPAEELEVPGS